MQTQRADTWKTRAGLVEAAAEKDPAGTLERMREAGWLSTQRSALIRLFRTWASRDPIAALETAVSTVKGLTAGDSDRERETHISGQSTCKHSKHSRTAHINKSCAGICK